MSSMGGALYHHEEFSDEGLAILSDQECLRLLGVSNVGRVGICLGAIPAVLPVNYRLVGSDVMFLTGPGIKLDAARRGQSVAFEVDEIDAREERGWSVLVVGPLVDVGPVSGSRAEALGLYPWAPGRRQHLIRLRPEMVSGRRILAGEASDGRDSDRNSPP
jgi:hypothetical protein